MKKFREWLLQREDVTTQQLTPAQMQAAQATTDAVKQLNFKPTAILNNKSAQQKVTDAALKLGQQRGQTFKNADIATQLTPSNLNPTNSAYQDQGVM
jgi:hypothetical protein